MFQYFFTNVEVGTTLSNYNFESGEWQELLRNAARNSTELLDYLISLAESSQYSSTNLKDRDSHRKVIPIGHRKFQVNNFSFRILVNNFKLIMVLVPVVR